MQVIKKRAPAPDVFQDIETTLTNAKAKGSPLFEMAEAALGPVLALVAANATAQEENAKALNELVAAQNVQRQVCKGLVASVHDDTFNACERSLTDPVYEMIYLGYGFKLYAPTVFARLPTAMKLNAMRLEKHPHARISPEMVAESAAALRKEADAMEALNNQREPLDQMKELLEREVTALGRRGQRELVNLKKAWEVNPGLPSRDIFAIIPGYSAPKKGKKAAATAEGSATTSPPPTPSTTGSSTTGSSTTGEASSGPATDKPSEPS